MTSFGSKLLTAMGFEEIPEEERYEEYESQEEDAYVSPERRQKAGKRRKDAYAPESKVVNLCEKGANILIYKPDSYESARDVVEGLRQNSQVVINMEGIKTGIAQRIIDFICGSVFAMRGELYRISHDLILAVSPDVEIEINETKSKDSL